MWPDMDERGLWSFGGVLLLVLVLRRLRSLLGLLTRLVRRG